MATTCSYSYNGKLYTPEEFRVFLSTDPRFKDLSPAVSSSEEIVGRATSIKSNLRISNKIPLSSQRDIIESLTFKILTNPEKDNVSNITDVKNQVKLDYIKATDLVRNASDAFKALPVYKNVVYGQKLLEEVVANIDEFVYRAVEEISKLDVNESFDEYYDDFTAESGGDQSDVEDSDTVHYNDSRSRTTNLKEFIPASVKKLMYFIPEYRLLNLDNEKDAAIYKRTGNKYVQVNNEIGYPKFNNFSDTWSKTLQLLSQNNFDTNLTGITQMLEVMSSDEAPYVVQQLAKKLQTANSQTQHAFFVKTNLQLQNSITSYASFEKDGQRVDRIFKSIDIVGQRKVTADLYSEFLSSSKIITTTIDEEGREIRGISREYANELYNKADKLVFDNDSYITYKNSRGFNIKELKDGKNSERNVIAELYSIFKDAGINISYEAFEDYVKNNWISNRKNSEANAKSLVSTILKRMAGQYSKTQLDPFENESSTIAKLARREFKYRPFKQADYFKQGSQSYYPFIKKSYLSDIFANLREDFKFVQSGNKELSDNSIAKRMLKTDVFAKHSRILLALYSGDIKKIGDYEKFLTPKYELGFDSDASSQEKKSFNQMIEAEHLLAEYIYFQNQGNNNSFYFYDTLSDKSVQIPMELPKWNVSFIGSIDEGNIQLDQASLDMLAESAYVEFDRINQVLDENKLLSKNQKIKGYHDIGTTNGMGKYFNIHYFLNKEILMDESSEGNQISKELLELLYPTGSIVATLDDPIKEKIKERINQHFNKVFANSKAAIFNSGLVEIIQNKDLSETLNTKGFFEKTYKSRLIKSLGINNENTPNMEDTLLDHTIISYAVGYAQKTIELLYFTGDPAQAGKFISGKDIATIQANNAENPVKASALTIQKSIENTLINLSKRNASLMASGEIAAWDNQKYNSSFAEDINIHSPHYDEYLKLFPGKEGLMNKSYLKGDGTDAWEVTTVEEYLTKNKAYGIINQGEFLLGLYTYDRDAYNTYLLSHPEYSGKNPKGNLNIVGLKFQPDKPVQRLSVIGPEVTNKDTDESKILNMSKQFYIKTSSFPLIPSLIKGTPWEDVLKGMKENNVQRIPFVSGVKQGVSGSKLLFNKDTGEYNKGFFNDNVHTLDRSGFRNQMDVPYHEDKHEIREGSQPSKLLFVDQHDSQLMIFKGKKTTAGKLKKLYVQYHKDIYNIEKQKFFDEIGIQEDAGIARIGDLSKLSKILIEEGLSKDFPINHLQQMDLDENGDFATPLTFALNIGTLEPMITAIISNRMARVKLPGYSYIQGSGAYIKGGAKGRIGTDISEAVKDKRDILWTRPEYTGMSRLSYISAQNSKDGLSHAQILISPHTTINGERIDLRTITKKDENNNIVIDGTKIDSEILELNGFRIPFQGLNSGMWFDIVGFLPDYVGDLAIVPEEIGAQMGSDYDVDKLYTYLFAFFKNFDGTYREINDNTTLEEVNKSRNSVREDILKEVMSKGSVKSEVAQNKLLNILFGDSEEKLPEDEKSIITQKFNDTLKERGLKKSDLKLLTQQDLDILKAKNNIIAIHKSVFTSKDNLKAMINPLAFDNVEEAIAEVDKLTPTKVKDFEGVYSPNYQREVYFSNVMGKFGVAVAALANTFHSIAQNSNAYLKGSGILIAEKPGEIPYSDAANINENRTNYEKEGSLIPKNLYEVNDEGNSVTKTSAWRLDKITTFDGKYYISDLISQILGVSVDNAKEQLLGRFGLNKHNFPVALLLIQTGFNLTQVKKFISQPILREYYQVLDNLENIYKTDFSSNRRQGAIQKIFDKYNHPEILGSEDTPIVYISDMDSALSLDTVNASNARTQLNLLKSFIDYSKYANDIQSIGRALNIDTRGLPKNISDTIQKEEDIKALTQGSIGNVSSIKDNSIPGVYSGLPTLTNELLTRGSNPIFGYGSTFYTNVKDNILSLVGRDTFFSNELDIIHNNIRGFIYSSYFSGQDLRGLRERWLFDSEDNKSLATRHKELMSKYPRNLMLQSLTSQVSKFANDPVRLKVLLSDDKGFAQKMTESWEDDLSSMDEELVNFSKDLANYAISTGNKEFGQSNMIRYIPFDFLNNEGFNDYLKSINKSLSGDIFNPNQLAIQILQHNPKMVKRIDDRAFVVKNNIFGDINDQIKVLTGFTLPGNFKVANEEAKKLGTYNSYDDSMSYPKILKVYSSSLKKTLLYISNGGYSYSLISKLGSDTETEYNLNQMVATSMFEKNLVPNISTNDSFIAQRDSTNLGTTVEEVTKSSQDVRELLDNTIGLIETYRGSLSEEIKNNQKRNISLYYKDLAIHLRSIDFSDVQIIFTNDIESNGQTSLDGKTIYINPAKIKSDVRVGLPYELNFTRVILHELIHSASNRNIEEGKVPTGVLEVYNAFKKAIWDGKLTLTENKQGVIRQIPIGPFYAELTKTLLEGYGNKSYGKDININNIVSTLESSENVDEILINLLKKVEASLNKLKEQGLTKINTNLTGSPTRLEAIKNQLRNDFIPNLRGMLNTFYAYTSVREFMAESTTNPVTMRQLSKVPSLWDRISQAITKFIKQALGLKDRTLLDDAVESVLGFIAPEELPNTKERNSNPITLNNTNGFVSQDIDNLTENNSSEESVKPDKINIHYESGESPELGNFAIRPAQNDVSLQPKYDEVESKILSKDPSMNENIWNNLSEEQKEQIIKCL